MSDAESRKEKESRTRDAVFWWRVFFAAAAAGFSLLLIFQPPPWRIIAEAGGEELSIAQLVYVGTWLGGLGAMVVTGLLYAICPWWARAPHAIPGAEHSVATPRWFWPVVLAAVIAGGATAAPTMNHSLWDDEHETLVWYVLGRYVRTAPDGEIKLKEHNWRRTIFGYSTPNNHIFHNILARSSNALWRAIARPAGRQFNEVALRIPAFLAGLACIAALAFLLKDFGFAAAGAIAAWFLALHPWFTHHMAQARGYTLTMLFVVLIFIFWRRALVSGCWLWFGLLAAAQFLALWTYPAAVFQLGVVNITFVLLVLRRPSMVAQPARTLISRWFCCNTLAAAGMLPLVGPLVPQMQYYIQSLPHGSVAGAWLTNLFCFFTGGAACDNGSHSGQGYLDLQLIAHAFGSGTLRALLFLTAALFVWGVIRFARAGKIHAAAVVCILLGPAAHWIYANTKGIILWEWYLIYSLPFVCLFWGVAVWTLGSAAAKVTRQAWAGPVFALAMLGLYALATSPVRAWNINYCKVPYRESVAASRAAWDDKDTMVFSTTGAPLAYDPHLFYIETPVDLAILMFQADAQNRKLVANMGQMGTLQLAYPKVFALVDSDSLFPEIERFKGFFSGGDRYVCRYAPGSVMSYDFTGILTPEEVAYARSKAQVAPEVYFAGRVKRHAAQDSGGYGPAPGAGKEPHGFKK